MYTINNDISNEIIIKNSRFICVCYKIYSKEDILNYLDNIKNIYKDATHYCYAYICDDIKKSSDDGEPGGTAGIPILQVLEKNNLNYILCIVIRYFGGIKLGAGGLVRAYTKSVTECLKNTNLLLLELGYNIEIEFSYDRVKQIDYILRNENIINKSYDTNIKYQIYIHKNTLDNLKQISDININIINSIYIEKRD